MTDDERDSSEREAARRERERRRALQAADAEREGSAYEFSADGSSDGQGDDERVEAEVPIGMRRVSHRERRAAIAPPPGSGRSGRRVGTAGEPVRRRGRRWIGRAIAIIPVVLVLALAWFLIQLYQPFHGRPHGRVTVVVPAHAGAHQIGNLLAADGVVPSGLFFDLRASLANDRGKLLSGTYHLQQGMTYGAVLKILTTPPPAAKVTSLTATPGHTRASLDALLSKQGIKGYLADTRHSPLLDPTAYGAPRGTPTLEGFMFPDTYQLRVPITTEALVSDQLKRFKQQFATVDMSYAHTHHLTPYQVLIVASLVEGEGQSARDMALVASVIYNRLREGMMLQMDSTTQYATGNFTRPLTLSQLRSPSPWNTRTHLGLPPTPINNPGMEAIRAAANPAQTNFLYFVNKPCSTALTFESDYTKFLHDAAAFNATTPQNGQPPQKHC